VRTAASSAAHSPPKPKQRRSVPSVVSVSTAAGCGISLLGKRSSASTDACSLASTSGSDSSDSDSSDSDSSDSDSSDSENESCDDPLSDKSSDIGEEDGVGEEEEDGDDGDTEPTI
jgi:hypothetical protein